LDVEAGNVDAFDRTSVGLGRRLAGEDYEQLIFFASPVENGAHGALRCAATILLRITH
jgi:hypothetical protein